MSREQEKTHCWKNAALHDWSTIDCLCIGTGRFLRSVLVPLFSTRKGSTSTALIQPRGRSFMEFMKEQDAINGGRGTYPVDTVFATTASASLTDDDMTKEESIQTNDISIGAAFSWGMEEDRNAFFQEYLPKMCGLEVIGVGITEAGLASHDTPAMHQLFRLVRELHTLHEENVDWSSKTNKIVIFSTDNVPGNGSVIKRHLTSLIQLSSVVGDDDEANRIESFVFDRFAFLDSMVDRIVSEREGSRGLVPRAEPTPAKALVLLDLNNDLPNWILNENNSDDAVDHNSLGLVVRKQKIELQADVALKLRIANGTHTVLSHLLALAGVTQTNSLGERNNPMMSTVMSYLDHLVSEQIQPAALNDAALSSVLTTKEVSSVWQDWRQRITHPIFGLSTFFITQNGPAKGGIRLGPTVLNLIQTTVPAMNTDLDRELLISLAFSFAVLLRWLTPSKKDDARDGFVYRGWLLIRRNQDNADTVMYADGMQYNLGQGWYEFKCNCPVQISGETRQLADCLAEAITSSEITRAYLTAPSGGNLGKVANAAIFDAFVDAVTILYARMVKGGANSPENEDPFDLLDEMKEKKGSFKPHGWSTSCRVFVNS